MKTFKVKIRKIEPDTEVDKDGHRDSFNDEMYVRGIKNAVYMGRNRHWYRVIPHARGTFAGVDFNYHESWLIFLEEK